MLCSLKKLLLTLQYMQTLLLSVINMCPAISIVSQRNTVCVEIILFVDHKGMEILTNSSYFISGKGHLFSTGAKSMMPGFLIRQAGPERTKPMKKQMSVYNFCISKSDGQRATRTCRPHLACGPEVARSCFTPLHAFIKNNCKKIWLGMNQS